ncbi:hypothetical protein DKX38_018624 [Salix brachista]|uniref:5-formyltetrahydrofolate cyclo-ligase n=1 Tax=Salix brachista TaxID=2182728 RepID=A0A5N5KNI4_9ROSI|nr:hypothetical protein DKX38_018624 [Salix brachista]
MWRSGLRQRVKELLMILPPPSFLPPSPSPTHHMAFTKKPLLGLANASPCSAVTMSTTTNNLDEIFKQKRVLRSKVRKSLKAMDPSLRSQEDDAIQSLVSEAAWFKSSQRLCAYITCYALREVDTSKLLSQILQNTTKDGSAQNAKKLYVPRVEDKNSHMRMLNISSMDDLIANSMDILEPAPVDQHGNAREDVMLANDPVDLFLLPGLAFDKSGRRLGRGGGYYDTFLRKYQDLAREKNWRQPLLVALSYSLQIIDDRAIPVTLNDVPVDVLVSPAGVIPISQAALNRIELSDMPSMIEHDIWSLEIVLDVKCVGMICIFRGQLTKLRSGKYHALQLFFAKLPPVSVTEVPACHDFFTTISLVRIADRFVASSLSNGFNYVTSDDLFFDGLSMEGNTAKIFGWSVTTANVLAFPGLNQHTWDFHEPN